MRPKGGIYIKFLPEDRDVLVSHKDESVLAVAIRAGIPLHHTCGGHATCGTCLVQVVEGLESLPQREGEELEMALDRGFQDNERLACQIPPLSGLVLKRGSK